MIVNLSKRSFSICIGLGPRSGSRPRGGRHTAIRCLQYLHCTRDLGLRFRTDHTHPVQTHTDSDWAGCLDTRQSTSGRVTMIQGAAVMWGSARQHSIALSSTEAEIIAACDAARNTRLIRRVHAALGIPLTDPTPLMNDSSSALTWSAKRAKWSASRHVATRYQGID